MEQFEKIQAEILDSITPELAKEKLCIVRVFW